MDFAQGTQPRTRAALAHTKINEPVWIAEYAYRELLVGRVGLLCDAHNAVIASANVVEVALSFSVRGSFARTPRAQAEEILRRLKAMFDTKSKIDPALARREIAEELMMIATKVWKKAVKFPSATRVQHLACFNNGSISIDKNGLLQGPNNSFNCATGTVCGAAQYMYNDRPGLRKMIAALDSPKLPDKLKKKSETRSRRKALDLLERRGPAEISKGACRQVGDAYFAAMCPAGAHVLTTNIDDFGPLCDALGKVVKTP
ncbi:MAG: hypothetical protein ACKVQA_00370 [Burkholderiales bacterium]